MAVYPEHGFTDRARRTLYRLQLDGTLLTREGEYSWFHSRRDYPAFISERHDAGGNRLLDCLSIGRHLWQLTVEDARADVIDRARLEVRWKRDAATRAQQAVADAETQLAALQAPTEHQPMEPQEGDPQ